MATDPTSGNDGGVKVGDKVWYHGESVTVICIIPAHRWPADYETQIDANVAKYMKPASEKFPPQQCRSSVGYWKKWQQPMYIIAYPPNTRWVCEMRRAPRDELSLTPPVVEPTLKKKSSRK
jgi:hypothetical protein